MEVSTKPSGGGGEGISSTFEGRGVHREAGLLNLYKMMVHVPILHSETEHTVEKFRQMKMEVNGAIDHKRIRTSNTRTNHTGSVHMKCLRG